ncbi:MAG: hypothetical protein V1792_25120, partial [Pseudomonadota bacterium]
MSGDSSTKIKNGIQGTTKEMDRRTFGAGRRQEAMTESTGLIVPMVRVCHKISLSSLGPLFNGIAIGAGGNRGHDPILRTAPCDFAKLGIVSPDCQLARFVLG